MKKTLFTLITTLCCVFAAFAQAPAHRVCGTLEHHEYLKQTRPNYVNDLNQYNQVIEQYLANQASGAAVSKSSAAIITIPVVVHVVYNTAAENITDAQAASQVQVLNDDFAKLNTDANKVTQPTFSTVAAGSQIRFCLAQRDPNGNPTTGIVHKSTTATSFGTNDAVKAAATGDLPWDVTKYVNIWVCDLSGTLLGYGEFPTGTISNTWGLVIDYAYTGKGGSAQAPFNLGRTGTHEFGHCFNLNHIWGDDGSACSGSDNCADTPNQGAQHTGAFAAGSIQTDGCTTTSPGTMWMNYMDYTDDGSMYMFTAQQVARMEAVINTAPWNVLQNSLGCTPVSSLDAGISSILSPLNSSSTCNTGVTPKVTLANAGSTTITSARILYKMDAAATQTLNWTGSLASSTSTVLTLNSFAGLTTSAHTFSVWVMLPNGSADQNTTNNSLSSTFTVAVPPTGLALPFIERFDATTFPPTGWVKLASNTLNAANTWSRLANTTGIPVVPTTTACAKMDNFSGNSIDITGQLDALRTPALSFASANSTLKLKFDVSHRVYSTTVSDSLNIYISTDCGGTWSRLYTKGGSQLSTVAGAVTTAFTPTANTQWRRDSISLSSYVGQASVYLKFESRSDWGNNLYIDNVNVAYTAAVAAPVAGISSTSTKCAGTPITFSDASTNAPTSWTWTFPGGSPASSTSQNPAVTYTASGTYTVTHTAANSTGTSSAVSQTIAVNANPTVVASNTTICNGGSANLAASGASTYVWNTTATTASITVTPTVTTNYTVTGTSAVGCTNTKTLNVTVNANPSVVVTNTSVCRGNSVALSASGASTYVWNTTATTASISVTPTVTTNYTVTGTSSLGCKDTKTVSVTVNALPTVVANSATICAGSTGTISASGASTYVWNTGVTTANLTASPTSNTNYTVTGTSTAGCVKTATASIVVGSAPAITVNSSTICAGSSATLSASGVTTYTWNNGFNTPSIVVNPSATSIYTVSGNLAGCSASTIKSATVTVNQLPNVNFGVIASPLCVNSSAVTLSATPAGGTYSGAGISGSSFDPALSGVGTFTLTYNYTNANTCSASATRTVNVSLCTGIEELSGSAVSVYPNPTRDMIYVTIDASLTNHTTIELYDAIGKMLISESVQENTTVLSLNQLAKGMYTIRIISENKQSIIKVIKE